MKQEKKIGRANKGKLPWITGKHHSEETKRKLSKVNKGKKLKKEHIRKMLKRRKMSSLEVKVNNVIQKHSLPYKFVGNGKFFIERKNPDFVNINGEKVAVEVYCRKHKENVRGLNIDKWRENRSKLFAKYGWQTIFIEDWQTNKEETVLSLLKAIHE